MKNKENMVAFCDLVVSYLIKFLCHSSDDLRVLHVAKHFSTDHT